MEPQLTKRPKPVAECRSCGQVFHGQVQFGKSHLCRYQPTKGRRKRGCIESRVGPDDWRECPSCAATGMEQGQRCTSCEGEGWHCTRDRF